MRFAFPVALLVVAACASRKPHRVTDLDTGQVYYTKHVRHGLTTGNVYFVDEKTGADVTIESSAVLEITEEEFAREVKPRKEAP